MISSPAVLQHSGSTTRGSISVASRGSNGTLKFTNIADIAASVAHKGSSGKELAASGTCTSSSGSKSQSQNKQSYSSRHKNSIGIQIDSSDSNHSTQATIASSCGQDQELAATNCIYCRRRMSNCDECMLNLLFKLKII